MYREKLKEMLPSTNDVDKVPTVNILGAAIDYCIEIQDEVKHFKDLPQLKTTVIIHCS